MKNLYTSFNALFCCVLLTTGTPAYSGSTDSLSKEPQALKRSGTTDNRAVANLQDGDNNCPPASELAGRKGNDNAIAAVSGPRGKMTILVNGLEKQEIDIGVYNIIGNKLYSTRFFKESAENITICPDVQFEPGIYFIMGTTAGNKFVKQLKLLVN